MSAEEMVQGTPAPEPTPEPVAPGSTPDDLRVGVYVCHCGSNIAGMVDVEAVRDWAADNLKDRGVAVARDYKFMCSSLGQELIEKDIKEHGVNRVVVASCSPHLHEPTFRNACARAGHHRLGLFRGDGLVVMDPRDLLADGSQLAKIWIQPGVLRRGPESFFVQMGGTSRDHDPCQAKFLDILFDQLLPQAGAHELVFA